jgi:hypothetical protein
MGDGLAGDGTALVLVQRIPEREQSMCVNLGISRFTMLAQGVYDPSV